MLILGSIVGLSLIGGLAIFCFTQAFGIVFLGEPRSEKAKHATEATGHDHSSVCNRGYLSCFIGLASPLVVKPVFEQSFRHSSFMIR